MKYSRFQVAANLEAIRRQEPYRRRIEPLIEMWAACFDAGRVAPSDISAIDLAQWPWLGDDAFRANQMAEAALRIGREELAMHAATKGAR